MDRSNIGDLVCLRRRISEKAWDVGWYTYGHGNIYVGRQQIESPEWTAYHTEEEKRRYCPMTEAEVIRLRLEQVHESLKEAQVLINNGLFRGTINRS